MHTKKRIVIVVEKRKFNVTLSEIISMFQTSVETF